MSVDVQFNVDQALAKLGELVSAHGPQAVDLAAQVVQVNGFGQVAIGAFALAIAVSVAVAALRLLRLALRLEGERKARVQDRSGAALYPSANSEPAWVGLLVSGVIGTGALIVALNCLLDVWAWVAIFNPKLALAHQVLAKVAGL